jgi:S-adenosylmethionine:tRNA ribosyltransferase-isomerase
MILFNLPDEYIAQTPASPRDSAKLLVYSRQTRTITDAIFSDINQFLPANTTLVVNNSKVEQCRYLFDDGRTELFVLEKLDTHTVRAMVRPGKRFKAGDTAVLTSWLQAQVLAIDDDGFRTLRLSVPHDDARLQPYEHIPLPPYIAQNDALKDEYQTVYAKPLGSKAAPTAGLHFTDQLLQDIKKDHTVAEVTLHVGLGTFAKLTDEQLASGHLHQEWYGITPEVAVQLNNAAHITAVGTTTTRTLESNKAKYGGFTATTESTDILIRPPYAYKAVNALITNFHLPSTSLLLLVEAFVGDQAELQRIYDHAIVQKYRFYSFGDAMLIL